MRKLLEGFLILVALTGAFAFAEAHGATINGTPYPAPDSSVTQANTAGVVLFEVNHIAQWVVFISNDGQISAEDAQACGKSQPCQDLALGLIKQGKVSVLDVESGTNI